MRWSSCAARVGLRLLLTGEPITAAEAFDRVLKSENAEDGPLAFAEKRQAIWKAR